MKRICFSCVLSFALISLTTLKVRCEGLPPAAVQLYGDSIEAEFGVELSIDKEKALPAYRTWRIWCVDSKSCLLQTTDVFALAVGGCGINTDRYYVNDGRLKIEEYDPKKGKFSFSWAANLDKWGEAELKVDTDKKEITEFSAKVILPALASDPIARMPNGLRVWEWSIPAHSYEYKPDCQFIVRGLRSSEKSSNKPK